MVLIRWRPKRFPQGSFTKLHARFAGSFRVTKKLGADVQVIDLPSDFGISPVFNINDITEFKGDTVELPTILTTEELQAPTLHIPKNIDPRDEIASILDHQFVTTYRVGY